MSKWLLKHYFRWNEKQNQKQPFDWIWSLCWTLPPNSSLPLLYICSLLPTPSFPWLPLGSYLHTVSLFFPVFSLSFTSFLPVQPPSLSLSVHPHPSSLVSFSNRGSQLFLFTSMFSFFMSFSLIEVFNSTLLFSFIVKKLGAVLIRLTCSVSFHFNRI